MEKRIAVIGIIVEEPESAERINAILHRFAEYVVGRMGIPYRERGIHIICIAVDAPNDEINSLTGALGRIGGITAKATFSKV